ncbi:hypothetical protein ILUMI_24653 [Ignelater luminosus]|uniref:UDP-glycosyltransferase n=1 Tax=Ignelater luminosus TaxID=2038154 RepID=A0A8K0G0S4_IGNLU|nr:hypothetical protein ILUMI_24653 [Ignelater luminosus]
MKLLTSGILLLTFSLIVNGYNILGIFPHPGKSHFDVFEPLMKELTKRGHQVTVISHFPQKRPLPRYEDVSLRNTAPIRMDVFDMNGFKLSRFEQYYDVINLMNVGQSSCENGLSSQPLKDFLSSDRKFDLIITEFFSNECFLGFVYRFKAPFIGISSCLLFNWHNDLIGNPSNPSYIPNNFLPLSDKLTFLERVENTILGIVQNTFVRIFMDNLNSKVALEVFRNDLPPLRNIAINASLVLVNSHFSLNLPRPLVPAVIEVGGLHIGEAKKLPQVIIIETNNKIFFV